MLVSIPILRNNFELIISELGEKNLVSKGYTLHNSIDKKCLKLANPQKEKVIIGYLGLGKGRNGELLLMGKRFPFGMMTVS